MQLPTCPLALPYGLHSSRAGAMQLSTYRHASAWPCGMNKMHRHRQFQQQAAWRPQACWQPAHARRVAASACTVVALSSRHEILATPAGKQCCIAMQLFTCPHGMPQLGHSHATV